MSKVVKKNSREKILPGVGNENLANIRIIPHLSPPSGLIKNNKILKDCDNMFGPRPHPRYAYQLPSLIYLNRMYYYAKQDKTIKIFEAEKK